MRLRCPPPPPPVGGRDGCTAPRIAAAAAVNLKPAAVNLKPAASGGDGHDSGRAVLYGCCKAANCIKRLEIETIYLQRYCKLSREQFFGEASDR